MLNRVLWSLCLFCLAACELPADAGGNQPLHDAGAGGGGPNDAGADAGTPIVISLCSDDGFCQLRPSLPVKAYPGIHAVSLTDVWAVGPVGTALHYDGVTWSQVKVPSTQPLMSVFGVQPGPVWAVGLEGTILKFEGGSWTAVTSPTVKNLRTLWGASADDLWAVGEAGTLLHYDGAAWSVEPVPVGVATLDLFDVHGTSAANVWASGANGSLIKKAAQGWTQIASGAPTTHGLLALHVVGTDDLFATSYYDAQTFLYRWNGTSLVNTLNPAVSETVISSFHGVPSGDLWALGYNTNGDKPGVILKWSGTGWNVQSVNEVRGILALSAAGPDALFASGLTGGLLKYNGAAWINIGAPFEQQSPHFQGLYAAAPDDVWAHAYGGPNLWHFDGTAWTAVAPLGSGNEQIRDIWGSSATNIWLATSDGKVFRSSGGAFDPNPTGTTYGIDCISGTGPNDVWVGYATSGKAGHWNGQAWTEHTFTTTATYDSFSDIWTDGAGSGWAVTSRGGIFRFNGAVWTEFTRVNTNQQPLWAVIGFGANDAVAAGNEGIWRFNGTNWTKVRDNPTGGALVEIAANGPNDIAILNTAGFLLHWNGTSWTEQSTGLEDSLSRVTYVRGLSRSGDTTYVAGDFGLIARRVKSL